MAMSGADASSLASLPKVTIGPGGFEFGSMPALDSSATLGGLGDSLSSTVCKFQNYLARFF